MQTVENSSTPGQLEAIAIKWSVDRDNKLVGRAKFISVKTHDILFAELKGTSPPPKAGESSRLAIVELSFAGGTGMFKGASGTAKVKAELGADGSSIGKIEGVVNLKEQ